MSEFVVMSVYNVQCVSSVPLLSEDRNYSDHSVPVSCDVSINIYDAFGDVDQPLIVPVGSGDTPYSASSVVSKNCSVSLYDFRVSGSNGSSAQYVTFAVYISSYGSASKSYVFKKRLYLAANEVFDISFDRVEELSLVPSSGLNQLYFSSSCTSNVRYNAYCNVVVDD